jgi:hypothetical protein
VWTFFGLALLVLAGACRDLISGGSDETSSSAGSRPSLWSRYGATVLSGGNAPA